MINEVNKPMTNFSQIMDLPIEKIRLGSRHRQDLGDLRELAQSIQEEGLLQPIGVTEDLELVFGERRCMTVEGRHGWTGFLVRRNYGFF